MVKGSGGALATAAVVVQVDHSKFAQSLSQARGTFQRAVSSMGAMSTVAGGALRGLHKAVQGITGGLHAMLSPLRALTGPWTALFAVGGAGALMGGTVKIFADFEQAMARVKALTNASSREFAALSKQARDLGRSTVFSAQDAATAMGNLAQSGFTVREIMDAMGPTLDLAAAGQLDMATASDIVSKIMRGMKLSTTETAHAVDVLAKAVTTSNTDLTQLGEAFKYVGPLATSSNKSLEEITATIQILSDAGIQASMAGTSLRQILINFASPSKEGARTLQELGITLADSYGRMKPFAQIIDELNAATGGMTEMQKSAVLSNLAESRSLAALIELMGAGGDKIREYEKRLAGAGGTAQRIARTQMDTLKGSFEQLRGALAEVCIELGSKLAPMLRHVAGALEGMMPTFQTMASKVGAFADAIGTRLVSAIQGANSWLQSHADLWEKVLGFFQMTVTNPFAALKAAAQTVQAGGLDLVGSLVSGFNNFLLELRAMFSATIATWAQRMNDAIITMGDTIRAAGMSLLSHIPGTGVTEDDVRKAQETTEWRQDRMSRDREGSYERNLAAAREAIRQGVVSTFLGIFADELHGKANRIRRQRATDWGAAELGQAQGNEPAAAQGIATDVWDSMKDLAGGFAEAGQNWWGKMRAVLVTIGAPPPPHEARPGGDQRSIPEFLADIQKKVFGKEKTEAGIDGIKGNTDGLPKHLPQQTDFLREIRNQLKLGVSVIFN